MNQTITIQGILYNLQELEQDIWHQLVQATQAKDDPFRTPALASISEQGIGLRTIVLREVIQSERKLIFHSDLRAPKILEIQKDSSVSLLFYDPNTQIQIRVQGQGAIHHQDHLTQEQWDKTPIGSLKIYLTEYAPGTPTDDPISGINPELENKKLDRLDVAPFRNNFAVIVIQAQQLDWLWIDRAGHRRARFEYQEKGLQAQWLIP